MKSIYLASPYGFSQQWKTLLPPIVAALRSLELVVWEPFERIGQVDYNKPGWAREVGKRCLDDVSQADGIFAVVNGTPPDEGVMVELGVAIALKKPTFLFRDDFRRCTDSEEYPLNLMLFTGITDEDWRRCFYSSVEEITLPEKALFSWANRYLCQRCKKEKYVVNTIGVRLCAACFAQPISRASDCPTTARWRLP